MNMQGKVAIVTGAASGIGKSIARLYVEAGASVMLSDIDEAAGQAVYYAILATAKIKDAALQEVRAGQHLSRPVRMPAGRRSCERCAAKGAPWMILPQI